MSRIRCIKPEFFDDEDVAAVSVHARLALIGLLCQADRDGRLEDRPLRLKVRLFPHDAVDMDALLAELDVARFIIRYEVDGKRLIQIRTFAKHQRPHVREVPSTYPAPTHAHPRQCLGTTQAVPEHDQGEPEGKGREGNGSWEGNGHGEGASACEPVPSTVPALVQHRALSRRATLCPPSPKNAVFAGKFIVPDFLDAEFGRKSGRSYEARMAWYGELNAEWQDRAIGEDDLRFLRARFAEWVGVTKTPPASKNAAALAAALEILHNARASSH
jgi:hypothetical protein